MPWSGPRYRPLLISCSACRASASAESESSVTTALSFLPVVDSRSRQVSVRATGEICFVRTRVASSRSGRNRIEGSSMAASGPEREVGFVAVRELACSQPLATLNAVVELVDHVLHLIGIEMLSVATLNDRGERLRVFGGPGGLHREGALRRI